MKELRIFYLEIWISDFVFFSFFWVELKIKLYRLAKLDPQPHSKEYTVRLKIFWANISGHNSGPEVQRKLAQIVNLEWDLDFFIFLFEKWA